MRCDEKSEDVWDRMFAVQTLLPAGCLSGALYATKSEAGLPTEPTWTDEFSCIKIIDFRLYQNIRI